MDETLQFETWGRVLADSLGELAASLVALAPKLAGALAILAVGWLISKGVESVARRMLERVGLDRAATRGRVSGTLHEAGIESAPSRLVARALFWVLMLAFLLPAVDLLGLAALTAVIGRLVAYLPNVIAAGLIVLLGLLLGRVTRGVVGSGASAAGVAGASRLGAAAQTGVFAIVAILALEQLGIEIQILVTLIGAVLVGVAATMGVAFALGARPVMTHILAGHFLRQSLPEGLSVQIGERRGVVERVGAVETLLRGDERAWSVPNARLLEEVVTR
jgi:hypothetical protein